MISKRTVKKYCREYWNIENYETAVNDLTQIWDCHHRREISENKSKQQLIEEGLYYDVNPSELIFLTKSEHLSIHHKGNNYWVGKHHSEETKQKMSENHNHNPNAGKQKKSVMCIETGEVFESLSEAAKHYNLFHNHILNCCNGKRKSCGKLHWRWV